MRIARVIGTVTLSRSVASLEGGTFRLVVPLSLSNLTENVTEKADPLVTIDSWNAGVGQRIAISEDGEAARPFRDKNTPVDTYNAAIVDTLDIDKHIRQDFCS